MSRPQPVPDEPQLPREPIQEAVSVVPERRLPTMKELLPPATGSLASLKDKPPLKPIPLGTQQPQYISYFGSIKRSIDSNWEYPQLALRYGLQGTLVVEFKILASGQLEALRLVRSSGSVLLDEEALRAIKAAAPFAPIPPWIEEKPLLISARMEYYDGRLNYRPGR
jgi:TonB family protein